ncbi:DUF7344 domain-containing protein [Halomicrococcus gelatinilyticus]|uniref:DUF7344 domain-containing protein n=1 Tax=Halomicrococcus gelatinilyticus TaxID=1702103 RepID=UPI002E1218C2
MSEIQRRASDDAESDTPSRDVIFQVLGNQRRRYALHYLKHYENPAEIGTLATQVAAWENEVPASDVTSQQRKRVYNTLQQAHLPKLNETGFVEYDAAHGLVELTDRAGGLDVYLELEPENSLPWSEYYLVLGGTGLALTTAAWLDAGPLGAVPPAIWGMLLGALVVVSGVAQRYYRRNVRLGHAEAPVETE